MVPTAHAKPFSQRTDIAQHNEPESRRCRSCELFSRLSPRHWAALGGVLYASLTTAIAGLRLGPWILASVALALVALGRRLADLSDRILPYLVFLGAYDALRYAQAALLEPERISVCGARAVEVSLFGFGSDITPGERLARCHTSLLDLVFAVPYFGYAIAVVAYSLMLFGFDRPRMSRFLWSFALANVIAFILWMLMPVAPPWYQHAYGCRVDLSAPPSAAGLLRVDALLDVRYFSKLYGKSPYLFGGWPSLHCTYPMIGLLTAWRHTGWRTRPLHLVYVTWMFCASVYLDHHYVIDGLSGFGLAGLSVYIVNRVSARRRRAEGCAVPAGFNFL